MILQKPKTELKKDGKNCWQHKLDAGYYRYVWSRHSERKKRLVNIPQSFRYRRRGNNGLRSTELGTVEVSSAWRRRKEKSWKTPAAAPAAAKKPFLSSLLMPRRRRIVVVFLREKLLLLLLHNYVENKVIWRTLLAGIEVGNIADDAGNFCVSVVQSCD